MGEMVLTLAVIAACIAALLYAAWRIVKSTERVLTGEESELIRSIIAPPERKGV